MDPTQQPGLIKLAKIATDRVHRTTQLVAQVRSEHAASGPQAFQNDGTTLVRQHTPDNTRTCLLQQ